MFNSTFINHLSIWNPAELCSHDLLSMAHLKDENFSYIPKSSINYHSFQNEREGQIPLDQETWFTLQASFVGTDRRAKKFIVVFASKFLNNEYRFFFNYKICYTVFGRNRFCTKAVWHIRFANWWRQGRACKPIRQPGIHPHVAHE